MNDRSDRLLTDSVVRRDDDTYRRESACFANENEDLMFRVEALGQAEVLLSVSIH